MSATIRRVCFGALLIAAGALFLLENLGYLKITGSVWGWLFAAGGLAFLAVLVTGGRSNWWAAIPGFTLLGIGALIILSEAGPVVGAAANRFGGALVLGGIALGFWVIYLLIPSNWWAIIPAGVLTTLAVITTLPNQSGMAGGGVFFIGLALTFALLMVLPGARGMRWPWIPALVLFVIGLFIILSIEQALNYVLPALLLAGGAALLILAFWKRS